MAGTTKGRAGQGTPPGVVEDRAGTGSGMIVDLDLEGEQHPGGSCVFWRFQLGGSGSHSWPRLERRRSWLGRKDNGLCFESAEFEVPGEMLGGQWNADLRARRELT